MTAMNVFVQPDAAYLLTDGALYESDGTIMELGSKALLLPEFRMVICPSGMARTVQIQGALEAGLAHTGVNTQSEAMRMLPGVAYMLKEQNQQGAPAGSEIDMQLFVAIWSDISNQPEAWALSSNQSYFGAGYEPFTWLRISSSVGGTSDASQLLGREVDCSDRASFDPEADGLTVIKAQRRMPWDDGLFYIGGSARLYSVRESGVEEKILVEWPDKVGELVTP